MCPSFEGIKAIVLAGGLGTRLRPLTENTPKPMVLVNGRPFLEWLLQYLRERGLNQLIISVGYKKETIMSHFGDGRGFGVKIEYAVEESPQGTAMAVKLASQKAGEIFFVLNGDTLVEFDPAEMAAIKVRQKARCVVAVKKRRENANLKIVGENIVAYDKSGKLAGANYVNCGVCLLSKDCVPLISTGASTFEEPLFSALIARKEVAPCVVEKWFDMGTIDGLKALEAELQ